MSIERKALAVVLAWVPCSCDPAYVDRGLIAPDCPFHHGAAVAVEALIDAGLLGGEE